MSDILQSKRDIFICITLFLSGIVLVLHGWLDHGHAIIELATLSLGGIATGSSIGMAVGIKMQSLESGK